MLHYTHTHTLYMLPYMTQFICSPTHTHNQLNFKCCPTHTHSILKVSICPLHKDTAIHYPCPNNSVNDPSPSLKEG